MRYKSTPPAVTLSAEEQWRIACHEAGHVITATRLDDLPFTAIVTGGEDARVEFDNDPLDERDGELNATALENRSIVLASGTAAEIVMFGAERPHAQREDITIHDRIRCKLGEPRPYAESVQLARTYLNAETVRRVAVRLQEAGTLE